MLTKPLHGSQKLDKTDGDGFTIIIEVIPNNEMYQLLLSFGEDLVVISPFTVREEIRSRVVNMNLNY